MLTSIEHLTNCTTIDEDLLLFPDLKKYQTFKMKDSSLVMNYENYWEEIAYSFVENNLHLFEDTTNFWCELNKFEFLQGSGRGHRFIRRQNSFLYRLGNLMKYGKRTVKLDSLPAVKFLYRGQVERKVSIRVAIALQREIYSELLRPLTFGDSPAIFDLGSGWGRYSILFAEKFPNCKIYAGELTESGRTTLNLIRDHFSLNINPFPFDYMNSSELIRLISHSTHSEYIIFSNHSIEQVTYLPGQMIEQILETGKRLIFIHVEPVGWQLESTAETIINTPPSGYKSYYNKNFLYLLDHFQQSGQIVELSVHPDYVAFGNIPNAGALIRYTSP